VQVHLALFLIQRRRIATVYPQRPRPKPMSWSGPGLVGGIAAVARYTVAGAGGVPHSGQAAAASSPARS
jgi:hypothetical protein